MTDTTIEEFYSDYDNMPYISEDRSVEDVLANKVPKRNMVNTEEGLLPGDVILLWRYSHGSFTNQYPFHKYFEYDYGIDGATHTEMLINEGYARKSTPIESLHILTAGRLKGFLKEKGVTGYSKLKKDELVEEVSANYVDDELESLFDEREYYVTEKGQAVLDNNQAIIDRHPQKKMYKK